MKKITIATLSTIALCMVATAFFIHLNKLPPIADNLPSDFPAADEAFKTRILETFPLGSPKENLVRTLTEQEFVIYQDKNLALFRKEIFPCSKTWHIAWEENTEGKITKLDPGYSVICI